MSQLWQMLIKLIQHNNGLTADERYLSQVADHHDFEVRVRALGQRSA